MDTDTEELYPAVEQMTISTQEYELHGSIGRTRSRVDLLSKIVAFIGLVVLALFITTIVLRLEQQSDRRTDKTDEVGRKSEFLKPLAKLEYQIAKLENESADEIDQATEKAQLLQALAKMRTKIGKLENRSESIQSDLTAQVQRKSQLLKVLAKFEYKIAKLDNESADLTAKVHESADQTDQAAKEKAQLFEALAKLRTKVDKLGNRSTDYCPLKYNGSCTWLELRSSGVAFEQAKAICAEQGGQPANIYSRDHFYMLMGYTTMFAFRKGWMEAWLGMTYDLQNKTALLSDGTEAPYVRWHPGYPKPAKCCQMGLNADVDQEDDSQDMFTMKPSTLLRGVLCET